MAFQVTITEDAERQLRSFSAREQQLIEAAIEVRLVHQPTAESRNLKRLRPNPFAGYELRVGDLRVLYNVEGHEVVLLLVGRKVGNTLVVEGEEFHAHQDDSTQPPGERPPSDAQ